MEKDNLLTTRFGRGGGVGDVLIVSGRVEGEFKLEWVRVLNLLCWC